MRKIVIILKGSCNLLFDGKTKPFSAGIFRDGIRKRVGPHMEAFPGGHQIFLKLFLFRFAFWIFQWYIKKISKIRQFEF